jgi:hypothetical protein
MTQMNKFEDLNGQFASLGTGMTQQRKFKDRCCTLLYKKTPQIQQFLSYKAGKTAPRAGPPPSQRGAPLES